MVNINTVRTVRVAYESTGADKVRQDAAAVASSQERMGQAAQQAASVTEQASKRQLSAANAYEKVRQQIDSAYKAQVQFERAQRTIDRASGQGVIGATERIAAIEAARARFLPTPGANENHPAGGGLSSYDRMFVRYQAFDTAQQLYSGASPGIVAAQQGGQVLQQLADREGGLGAGLKQLGVSALGLVTPFTVAATAIAGIGVAFGAAAVAASRQDEALRKATQGIGATTGATVAQLDALARGNAEAGKVSTSTARDIVVAYASTGQFALPVIENLTRSTSEYARLTGQEVPAAADELARFFSDPAKGADELTAKIGGLDDRTRQLIATQVEQGDKSAAQESLAAALKAQIDANAVATTGWAAAWNTVTSAADRAWESLKRAAGAATGLAPESAAAAVERLNKQVAETNRTRGMIGMQPLGLGDSLIAQRDAAAVVADTERRQAEARAAEERANQASRAAGAIGRSIDPNAARLAELTAQQSTLRDALADPLARGKLADLGQAESAYNAVTRAIGSLTDANGKLIGSEEMGRRADQLRLDALKATTDAEKAAVAQRQKAFDLIGKPVTGSDARGQIERAGALSLAGSSSKGGGGSSGAQTDEYDRAVKSLEDRIRRQQEDAATYGQGAAAVARYRAETDLLTAAKRAERDVTPELTASIKGYADRAAEAAGQQEKLRDAMRDMDSVRSGSKDVFGGMFSDISKGTSAANTFANALGKIGSKLTDLAASAFTDALFGKTGSSGTGLLGSLLGGASQPNGGLSKSVGGFFDNLFGGSGFAAGGYTGPGGRLQPAGIVHAGEYVFDAASTKRLGLGKLEAIRSGMPGYASGGYVDMPDSRRAPVGPMPAANSNSAGGTYAPSYAIDLRGSTLTEAQVRTALAQAISANNDERDRTSKERGEMLRRAAF